MISGDTIIAGPFPTITFAMQMASGEKPAPAPIATFRHFKVIREVRSDASA